jgi:hypothetical protein
MPNLPSVRCERELWPNGNALASGGPVDRQWIEIQAAENRPRILGKEIREKGEENANRPNQKI